MLKAGDNAPDFKLMGDDQKMYQLSSFKGYDVVIYFYPKDNTPGCTQEACDFRDNLQQFMDQSCRVFGISKDSLSSHDKFKNKYQLNFTLLSDADCAVQKAYGAWEQDKTIRSTFLIDKEGKIKKIWSKVKVPGHIKEILSQFSPVE